MGGALRWPRLAGLVTAVVLSGATLAAGVDGARSADAPSPPSTMRGDAAAGDRLPSVLRLAQASLNQANEAGGQTLQFGAPASPAPGQSGESLTIGTPPAPVPSMPGPSLQIGAPPPPGAGAGLQIGGPAPKLPMTPAMAPPEVERVVSFSVPWLRAEVGALPDDDARADFSGYLSGAVRAVMRPKGLDAWSFQGTVRADLEAQSGRFEERTTRLDYGESFVRYDDGARTRITLGAQTVLWGRVDEIPPTDQMSVQDITRGTLDELAERRRAVPALRIEHSFDALKVDAVLMPWLRPAELADRKSVWHPIRKEDGRILGIGNLPFFNQAIRLGTIGKADDFEAFGGTGVRVSRSGSGVDAALTVQRTRRSLPYYQIDPAVRAAVLQGVPLDVAIASGSGPTFREVHPLTWVFGGDAAFEALGGTVRVEAAYLSDVPVTTLDGRLETHGGLDWVAGYEFFPGDGNARVTLQVVGHHVFDTPTTLERTRVFALTGEVEVPFAQERWRVNTRFSLGLNDRDIYVNPTLSFVGWEPHEFYVGAHLFSGSQRTINGFYEDNDSIVMGWRAKF